MKQPNQLTESKKTVDSPKPTWSLFLWLRNEIVRRLYEWLSVNDWLKWLLWERKKREVPAWFSEFYVISWLLFGILCFILSDAGMHRWWFLIPIYRMYELPLFFVHWILVTEDPLYSYRRSLAGIFLNFLEVIIYSAIALALAGCFGPRDALYNSVINILTISIANAESTFRLCKSIMVLELLIADFLILIVLANLVGQLRKKEGYGHKNSTNRKEVEGDTRAKKGEL